MALHWVEVGGNGTLALYHPQQTLQTSAGNCRSFIELCSYSFKHQTSNAFLDCALPAELSSQWVGVFFWEEEIEAHSGRVGAQERQGRGLVEMMSVEKKDVITPGVSQLSLEVSPTAHCGRCRVQLSSPLQPNWPCCPALWSLYIS